MGEIKFNFKRMNMKNADIYYFSGTGNTLLVVKKIKEVFEEKNVKTNLFRIEDSDPKEINLHHTIGLGFPVAGSSTYPFIWKFIKELPEVNGTDIFMVDTLGAYSGGIVGPLRKVLEKKGYKPIGAYEIKMPNNFYLIDEDHKNRTKIEEGVTSAENYAIDLMEGNVSWGRVPVFSDIIYHISVVSWKCFGTKFIQKKLGFKVDETKCNNCYICMDLCPINNIKKDKYPKHQLKCQFCMRCSSFCHGQAISTFNKDKKIYKSVNVKEFLNNCEI
jgi:flavodoxin/ferredoxin